MNGLLLGNLHKECMVDADCVFCEFLLYLDPRIGGELVPRSTECCIGDPMAFLKTQASYESKGNRRSVRWEGSRRTVFPVWNNREVGHVDFGSWSNLDVDDSTLRCNPSGDSPRKHHKRSLEDERLGVTL